MTLHGPDGTNYPNSSVSKEIISLKKIVFEHFNPHFITSEQSIVSAYFTIYAYKQLKAQLEGANHLNFLFGEATFI